LETCATKVFNVGCFLCTIKPIARQAMDVSPARFHNLRVAKAHAELLSLLFGCWREKLEYSGWIFLAGV
jgi:hypothetical protein